MNRFDELAARFAEGLRKRNITIPTPVQEQGIPAIQSGGDWLMCAPPGTGKTLTFLLPLLEKLDPAVRLPQVIILTPTHELAMQIVREVRALIPATDGMPAISAMAVIGKVNLMRQIDELKDNKPQVVVGSAGRMLELAEKGKLKLHLVKSVVLDEADRLLTSETYPGTLAFFKRLPRDRQVLFFSASVTAETEQLAGQLALQPKVLRIEDRPTLSEAIEHQALTVESGRDKIKALRAYLAAVKPASAIVFVNQTAENTDLCEKLNFHDFGAASIHGDLHKEERAEALRKFRSGQVRLLVASDIAARGLDLPGTTHIINLDLPVNPLVYLHRAGRTGRAGRAGICLTIATLGEAPLLRRWEKELRIHIEFGELGHGRFILASEAERRAQKTTKTT